jgi:hypothetical protein
MGGMSRMSHADSSAEILKLGHQLGVPPSRLEFLATVPPDDLRALRVQIGEALFQADRHHFGKIVAVSKMMPSALAARITEFAISPLIAARTAELLEPARAVDMVKHLSPRYVADVSSAMDPMRSPDVLAQIPADRVAAVAVELAARGEWVVIGSFVSVVSPDALRASIAVLTGEQLLRIAFVLDDMSRLDDIMAIVTDGQVDELLAAAAGSGLWRELDELLATMDAASSARLAGRYPSAGSATTRAVDRAVSAGALSRASAERLATR